jgi:N-acetyl-1-D-myo-inositol-2-amino-2-deoxy-alpha-D-glucopyranoside deacetylase
MVGLATNDRPDCFWRADLLEAASELVSVIRETRPQVLITYDTNGGYGHPDHIQAHRVAMYAAQLAAVPSFRPDRGAAWDIAKIYWLGLPKSFVQRGIDALVKAGGSGFFGIDSVDDIPWAVDDAVVTTRIEGMTYEPAKIAALRAHATQVELDGPFFRMSEELGPEAMGHEFFVLVHGRKGTATLDADGRETDLFDGVS